MQDEWTDRLSEYLDGELAGAERAAIESHLAGCARCVTTLDELKRVAEKARSLGPRPPQNDLWPDIAGRVGGSGNARVAPFRAAATRRFSFTLPQLAAAAVLIAVVSATLAWRLGSPSPAAPPAVATVDLHAPAPPEPSGIVEPVSLADAQYDAAVADLERALAKGRSRLDKTTIAIVEENLTIIDQALAQARQALAADPANSYLSGHLVETRRKKLDLLRRATALASQTN